MSDYLGNIIARSHSMVDSIKPRLPSLFEPLHPSANSLSEIIDSHEQRETEITGTPERAKAVDMRPLSPNSSFIPPAEHQKLSDSSPLHSIERKQLQQDSHGDGPNIQSPIKQNQGLETIINKPIREETEITSFKPASSSSKQIFKQRTILIPGADRYLLASQSKLNPQIEMHFHSKTEKFLGSNQVSEPTPSVQVNIGRVEVRAIMPEPMKPRKTGAPAAPNLSLEEYLKQRSGGRR